MDKLRLGIVGVGSVVREIYEHLYFRSEWSRLLSVEAVAEVNERALATFCDRHDISKSRRFTSYEKMIDAADLDAIQVNTPDSLHRPPTVYALQRGLDVLVPKPLAASLVDAHAMIEAARSSGQLIGVDFHKRDDPRIKEVTTRYQSGAYGKFQVAVLYMLDKLMVADPNHEPRFFASPDFAARNSPISFLTVHMADALIQVVRLRPVRVRATGYAQKLPTLTPVPVDGYDMCDTEVVFEGGGVAHIIAGWHVPDGAYSTTVQSARMICTDGLIDLGLDMPGCREIVANGVVERNPLFRNFESDGTVTGYGMSRPGRIYEMFVRNRSNRLSNEAREEMMSLFELGFYTTVVCEAAELSLRRGQRSASGAVHGVEIDVADLLETQLGTEAPGLVSIASAD